MAFKVGQDADSAPLTKQGIPYLYGSEAIADTINPFSPFDARPYYYNDDSSFARSPYHSTFQGGYDYNQLNNNANSGTGNFGRALAADAGIVAVGAPATAYEGRYDMGMVAILDCPWNDSIGTRLPIARLSDPDYASYPTGGATSWSEFGSNLAMDDNKVVVCAVGARESSGASYDIGKAWLYEVNGTLISQLDPNSQGVEVGKSSSYFGYAKDVVMDAGTIAVKSQFLDSATGYTGLISLFDYEGNLKKHVRQTDLPWDRMFSHTPTSFDAVWWCEHIAMADGHLIAYIEDWGIVVKFDYQGNYKKHILLDDVTTVYRNFTATQNGTGALAIGNGVIAVAINSAINVYKLALFDYDLNFVKLIPAPTYAREGFGWTGLDDADFRIDDSKRIAIGSGFIACGLTYDDPSGDLSAGSVVVFDLDGNAVRRRYPLYNTLKLNAGSAPVSGYSSSSGYTDRSYHYFGSSVAIDHCQLVVGGQQSEGAIWRWYFNPNYTPYDVKKLNKYRSVKGGPHENLLP